MTRPKPMLQPLQEEGPADDIARVLEGSAPYRKIPAGSYCRMVTREGPAYMARPDYEAFVLKAPLYDLLIDGVRMKVFTRRGRRMVRRSRLTPGEFVMISEYILTGAILHPCRTRVGRKRTPEAARKLFDRARLKVDTRYGRYRYRIFRFHKATDANRSGYEFVPTKGMRYCLIVPIHR